jgi:hypothetical protein
LAAFIAYVGSQHPTNQQPTQVQAASTYFTISDQAALYRYNGGNTNSSNLPATVLITQVGFSFTPIGGPADNLELLTTGNYDPTNIGWAHVAKGNTTPTGDVLLPYAIPSTRQSDGTYTLNVTLWCDEARGIIVLHFTTDELHPA